MGEPVNRATPKLDREETMELEDVRAALTKRERAMVVDLSQRLHTVLRSYTEENEMSLQGVFLAVATLQWNMINECTDVPEAEEG